MPKKAKAEKQLEPAELVADYSRAREAGKRGYARADRLIREIAAAVKPGERIELNQSGRFAVLRDRFAESDDKAVIWTPCAARRWDLEIVEP